MRFLLIPWGRGMGHITRCLAIARAIVQRKSSNQVTIVAEQGWEEMIKQIGCRHLSFPAELLSSGPWEHWDELFHVHNSLEADLHLFETVKPDVVLHDVRPSIPVACELTRIPCVTVTQADMSPDFHFLGETKNPFWANRLPPFQKILALYGLQPVQHDVRELFFRHQVVIPGIPEFDPLPLENRGNQVQYAGPLLFSAGSAVPPGALLPEGNTPFIFVYGIIQTQFDLDNLLDAFRDSPYHLLLAALPAGITIPEGREKAPFKLTVYDFVDVTAILPHCVAALIHGGHESCMALLKSGIPALVLLGSPPEPERMHNGQVLAKMGVARCLLKEDGWERVLDEVQTMTGDLEYARQAQRWQKHLQHWKGPETVVDVLMRSAVSYPAS
jgi:UDP:flavonoid glycosyltransferase YjiC (YdhE family)